MKLLHVPFYSDTLTLIEHNGQPYIAMRPIVENMGLDWRSQQRKLNSRFHSIVVNMTTVATDGKTREMLCLPLQKLPAWLFTVHPRKVAAPIRAAVERYQAESEAALWSYWTGGQAKQSEIRRALKKAQREEQQSRKRGSEAGRKLNARKLEKQRNQAVLTALQAQLDFVFDGGRP